MCGDLLGNFFFLGLLSNPPPPLCGCGNGQLLRWCCPWLQHQQRKGLSPYPFSPSRSSFTFAYTWSTGGKQDTYPMPVVYYLRRAVQKFAMFQEMLHHLIKLFIWLFLISYQRENTTKSCHSTAITSSVFSCVFR